MKQVHVVLHGGLGNQLFQIFKSIMCSSEPDKYSINLYSNLLKNYSTAREIEVLNFIGVGEKIDFKLKNAADILLDLRIPKVLQQIFRKEIVIKIPWYGVVVDGYFQACRYYDEPDEKLVLAISSIRNVMIDEELPVRKSKFLNHIRLGDFFSDDAACSKYIKNRLELVSSAADIVTNDETLLYSTMDCLGVTSKYNVIETADYSAYEVFKAMLGYELIITNGSTLAFWAAILSGAELRTSDANHQALFDKLSSILV